MYVPVLGFLSFHIIISFYVHRYSCTFVSIRQRLRAPFCNIDVRESDRAVSWRSALGVP